jgi:hypothetical protein
MDSGSGETENPWISRIGRIVITGVTTPHTHTHTIIVILGTRITAFIRSIQYAKRPWRSLMKMAASHVPLGCTHTKVLLFANLVHLALNGQMKFVRVVKWGLQL